MHSQNETDKLNLEFSSLSLIDALTDNLQSLEYKEMTPVQAESLPSILAGIDVIAQAKTGSGKTAAFGLGILNKLDVARFRIQSLVLCPTRELADQVANEIRRLARTMHNVKVLTLCGGKPFGPQLGSLSHGAHIIVGTPGRVEEHLRKKSLSLEHVDMFVLDEADRMLEMGFQEALEAITEALPTKRQTLLFSATYPKGIERIASKYLSDPKRITIKESHSSSSIQQLFFQIEDDAEKDKALIALLNQYHPESVVVFCNTKAMTSLVADNLTRIGFSALALNGDLEQKDRDQILIRFASKALTILVATDVAARGLDISGLDMVVNYELSRDPEVHVHRVGRTGRAGESGLALSFYSERESYKLGFIADACQIDIAAAKPPVLKDKAPQAYLPKMSCIQIDGGKKDKLRPGDILGALTSDNVLKADQIGKISILPMTSFVAIERSVIKKAMNIFNEGKMKGKKFRVRNLK